jgi:hypothetical protein
MEVENGGTRYELKMVCDGLYRHQAEGWIRQHSLGFRTAYPQRRVNNIYFDTYDLDTYNDHLEGVGLRRKLRYRWYGEDLSHARGQLEVKNKKGRVGWKIYQPIAASLDLADAGWAEISRTLQEASSGVFAELLGVTRPVSINTYQRRYFVSADGRVRMTLDFDLLAYDQQLSTRPNLQFKAPGVDVIVLEFKSEITQAPALADALAEFPLRTIAFSKYVGVMDGFVQE